jgi:hypothetical protein
MEAGLNNPLKVGYKTVPRAPMILALGLLILALAASAWWISEAVMLRQTLREGRTVADMAESVGRWASKYGGVHVRTKGADSRLPGSFLTRSVYAGSELDGNLLQGALANAGDGAERQAMQRMEAYHWKNPALIQREVADALAEGGLRARYRMTARTVLNPNNAPSAFETEALDALQAQPGRTEYWRVSGPQLLYARAVLAQKSCLTCHASAEAAPEFLRSNPQFNGGGGFGYVEGKPAGLISVALPIQPAWQAMSADLPLQVWLALGVAGVAALVLLWGLVRRQLVLQPVPLPSAPSQFASDSRLFDSRQPRSSRLPDSRLPSSRLPRDSAPPDSRLR